MSEENKNYSNSKVIAMMKEIQLKDSERKTLEDSSEEKIEKLVDLGNSSEAMKSSIHDHYGNTLSSIGTDDKVQSFTNYGFSNDTLNWPLWLALYNDSWVFRRAIDKPSTDVVRCGITLSLKDEEKKDMVLKDLKKYRTDFINLLQWGSLFGGSVAVVMFDTMNNEDYAKPMDLKKIQDSKSIRLYVTDRWYGVGVVSEDTVSNMKSLDFGKPKTYRITFADGVSMNVHHDFILRYEHRTAPKLILVSFKVGDMQKELIFLTNYQEMTNLKHQFNL